MCDGVLSGEGYNKVGEVDMTVGELIKELQQYSPDIVLFSKAADCGGYDAIFVSELQVMIGDKHPSIVASPDIWPEYINCLFVGGKDKSI